MLLTFIRHLRSNQKFKLFRPSDSTNLPGFFSFKIPMLQGKKEMDFSQLAGKKTIVMNVASHCGFTPQYGPWQEFYEKHGAEINLIGIPANNFLRQEPAGDDKIAQFCELNFGVSFPMLTKLEVIGRKQHPLYNWLSDAQKNGWNKQAPTWNFCKYVIDEYGQLQGVFGPAVEPNDPELLKLLESEA
jgi:glutathione peroxidase